LSCLLCYRDTEGNPVYSEPVENGELSLILENPAANDIVIAVIVNTDYIYEGEETRKAHFDYRIQIDTSLTVPAHTHKRWYAWDDNPSEDIPPVLPPISLPDTFPPVDILLELDTVYENESVGTAIGTFSTIDSNNVNVHTYSLVPGEGGDDNTYFRISDNNLIINRLLDYEVSPVYSIRIRTTDAYGNAYDKPFEIHVVDVEPETYIKEMNSRQNIISFYPNPFGHSATVKLLNQEIIQKIEIINLTGTTMKVIDDINANECTIRKEYLSNGVYFIKINSTEIHVIKAVIL